MSGVLTTILTLGGLAFAGYYLWVHTDFRQFIQDVMKPGAPRPSGPIPAPRTPAASGGGAVPAGNTSAAKGSFMFPGTGKTWTAKDSGKKTRNYASGKASTGTTQWDISGVGAVTNIETDLWVNVGSCKDSVSTKIYGGSHSGGNCCWLILNVDCASGTFELGGEGPHPTTQSSNLGKGGSMGSIQNKEVGIKLVSTKSGNTFTAVGYGNTGSGWKEYIRKTFSQFGASKKASSPASGATVQFRTDCSGVKYSVARAQEVRAGGAASAGASAPVEAEAQVEEPKKKKSNFATQYSGNFVYLEQPRYSYLVDDGEYVFRPSY